MNDSEEFDVVCIGSSPLSIREALHQDRLGKKTLLIESSDRLGGAWSDFPLFGLKRVEIAPHLLRFDKVAYEFLKNILHISIKPLSPQPKYLIDSSIFKVWIPFSAAPWITLFSVLNYWLQNPKLLLNAKTWRTSQERLAGAMQMLVQQ